MFPCPSPPTLLFYTKRFPCSEMHISFLDCIRYAFFPANSFNFFSFQFLVFTFCILIKEI